MKSVDYGDFVLHHGDCLDVLRGLADASVDSVVTDPPYGLAFMGKKWDVETPGVAVWAECLRVLKPGGHVLAFSGTRTQHRMVCAIEDAGFEIRDQAGWMHGSGFPKSLDVSKAIDKAAGAEREAGVLSSDPARRPHADVSAVSAYADGVGDAGSALVTLPVTDAARQWQGWGTALKPAWEPICVARKPLIGTVAENVLAHGTGGLNIDGCRVATESGGRPMREVAALREGVQYAGNSLAGRVDGSLASSKAAGSTELGRWPANLIHDGSDEVVGAFPYSGGSGAARTRKRGDRADGWGVAGQPGELRDAGSGSAARFFYCAKASKSDRDDGLAGMPTRQAGSLNMRNDAHAERNGNLPQARANTHPTVKPTELMRYLCRLVTPPGGVVLDPFMGSGSTGKGAVLEGFKFIGIDRDDWLDVAARRIATAKWGPWVFGGAA